MDIYVVLITDAYGRSEVRKVSLSLADAQNYVHTELVKGFASDIPWAYLSWTTECWVNACIRGPKAGFEPVTVVIQCHEILDESATCLNKITELKDAEPPARHRLCWFARHQHWCSRWWRRWRCVEK